MTQWLVEIRIKGRKMSRLQNMRPSDRPVPRRRVLGILAASAGMPLLGGRAALAAGLPRQMIEWRGVALGTEARMVLTHDDPGVARSALTRCLQEVARLEGIFSLYRSDSELFRLNRQGHLKAPSHDLVRLLSISRRYGDLSGGAFDVSVQPLWSLYAGYFADHPDGPGPDRESLERALRLVDYRAIDISSGEIAFQRPKMAITLNGIAQGYITERVGDLLRHMGFSNVLINLGETRVLDEHPEGRPWRIGLSDPVNPDRRAGQISLVNQAIASSAPGGFSFDASGRHHHLFDPVLGQSPDKILGVSVIAPRATDADALSTALSVMALASGSAMIRGVDDARAIVTKADGQIIKI